MPGSNHTVAVSRPLPSNRGPNCPNSVIENLWRVQVELGGGVFRGVQTGEASLGFEPLILFDDASAPKSRCLTLEIAAHDLTADRVRTKIRKKRDEYKRFEELAEMTAKRMFLQFAAKTEAV